MKRKFKLCHKKNKVPFKKMIVNCKGISHLDAMSCMHNFDVLNKYCLDLSKKMINSHEAFKKPPCTKKCCDCNKKDITDVLPDNEPCVCDNYTNTSCEYDEMDNADISDSEPEVCDNYTNESCDSNDMESVDTLPASETDIINDLTQHDMSDFLIQTVIKLDGRLDFERMKKAVRLSIDAEPVLRCRFVGDDPPHWKRMNNIDEISFCSMEEANDPDQAVTRFFQTPLDMDNDLNVKVKIIRSEQYDLLGVKINHECCDRTGAKEYIQLLSDIYSRLDNL